MLPIIRIRQSRLSSHLEQSMGQKPINEGRQMASKIKLVKTRQSTVFPRGVASFFRKTKLARTWSFFGRSITNVTIKTNQTVCTATVFPKTALLRGKETFGFQDPHQSVVHHPRPRGRRDLTENYKSRFVKKIKMLFEIELLFYLFIFATVLSQ